ncbi:diguanylate cyclase [Actinoplanes sp. NPDC089786]|uniref:diguanylate cyclase domain-containing protein n=1 Tax=Actinoplanes sp. NPDC089786 TaxID=3155185 RepID=UPI00342F9E86
MRRGDVDEDRRAGHGRAADLPDVAAADATTCLDHIRRAVAAHPWHLLAGELAVTISAGVASGSSSLPELLSEADRNLYAAKHAGRDRVVFRPAA